MSARALLGAAVAVALAVPGTASAAPRAGEPDPSFGQAGRVVLPYDVQPAVVLVQPDGKLVLPDSVSSRVLRLNPDGSPDRSFDGDGLASAGAGEKLLSAALQPDGKLLVGGVTASLDSTIARLNPTGSLDRTFSPGGADGDGRKVNGLGIVDRPSAIVAEPGGRMAVFGNSSNGAAGIRLDSAGSSDGTIFEPAGDGGTNAAVRSADGTFVVVGTSYEAGDWNAFAARWREDGKLDTTFAGKGWTTVGSPAVRERTTGVLVQPDGKPVLVNDTGTAEIKTGLTRLTATGEPDGAFGDGGFAAPDFDGDDLPVGAGLQADGKLVVGSATSPGYRFAAARYTPQGTLDPAYGEGGKTTVAFDDAAIAQAATAQPDGKLVIAGWTAVENRTKMRTALVRLLAEDVPVPQSGGSGEQPGAGQVPDTTLSFALSGAKRQRLARLGAIRVRLQSALEASSAVVRASGRAGAAKLRLRPRTVAVAAGPGRTVALRLNRKQRRAIRAALAAGKRPRLTVVAEARDAAGNRVRLTLRVTAKR